MLLIHRVEGLIGNLSILGIMRGLRGSKGSLMRRHLMRRKSQMWRMIRGKNIFMEGLRR